MPETPDPLTAELDAIEGRQEHGDLREFATADSPRLLKLARDVLTLHQPGSFTVLGALCKKHKVYRHFSVTPAEAERASSCPECVAAICVSCTCGAQDLEHCAHRLAVSAALLGEEPGHE